nr:hypothetical protein [Anaerobacillus sp. CMMVII]
MESKKQRARDERKTLKKRKRFITYLNLKLLTERWNVQEAIDK